MKTDLARPLFVVMGVSGCGKSSVGRLLASRTSGLFLDADDFHPPENKAKMAAAIPLTDADRWEWLDRLNGELKARARANGGPVFLACSALKQVYRERLAAGLPALRLIYLRGSKDLIKVRLQARTDHFMPSALLESQFATLEEPPEAIVASIEDPSPLLVDRLLPLLAL